MATRREKPVYVPPPAGTCIICNKPLKDEGGWHCSSTHDKPFVFPWDKEGWPGEQKQKKVDEE